MLETIHPFAVSFVIGLLIGIERERSHPQGVQAMGVRSFILFGILGTLAARLEEPSMGPVMSLIVLAMIAIGYFRSTSGASKAVDIGVTTELSAATVFGLGFLTASDPGMGALLGMLVLAVLASRLWLHRFVRETLLPAEIQSAILLLTLAVAVPFLPGGTVDPWGLFKPRRFLMLIVLIAFLQFSGYVAQRLLGRKRGLLFTGFLGGFVSSTMVFATLPSQLKSRPQGVRVGAAAAGLAVVASLIEVLIVLLSASPSFWFPTGVALLGMSVAGILLTVGAFRRSSSETEGTELLARPVDFRAVLKLTGILASMFFVVALANRNFGEYGAHAVALFGGFFELHSVTLASALLFNEGKLSFEAAQLNLWLALTASFVSKLGLVWLLGPRGQYALRVSFILAVILGTGLLIVPLLTVWSPFPA